MSKPEKPVNRKSRNTDEQERHAALQKTADYLYTVDTKGNPSDPELLQAFGQLRQMINEEFVGKEKQVSSQLIYDILSEAIDSYITSQVNQRVKAALPEKYDPEYERHIDGYEHGWNNCIADIEANLNNTKPSL